MVRALYMILANTIKKLRDSGGWHLGVATVQNTRRIVENTSLEKCLNLKVHGSPGMIQVASQKLEPLMQAMVNTNLAMPKEASFN